MRGSTLVRHTDPVFHDMKFAVFDLDHTLLPVDSGENWSRWLVRAAGMDVALMDARIEA